MGQYDLAPIKNTARDLANARGLTDMERNGLGQQWQHNYVRRALAAKYDPSKMMADNGANMISNGMEYSGAYNSKLPGMIASAGFGISAEALGEAKTQSDRVSDDAFKLDMSLSQNEDQMAMNWDIAQKNISLQESQMATGWDKFLQVANLGIGFAGVGGFGAVGKAAKAIF